MPTIHIQLALTFDESSVQAITQVLGPALKQALTPTRTEADDRRDARLRSSRNALFAGQKPADESLLIDSRQAAKLLGVSDRTLWKMRQAKTIVPPVKFGKAIRWNAEHLKKWIDEGCLPPKS